MVSGLAEDMQKGKGPSHPAEQVAGKLLRVEVTCKGITPLLLNPMSEEEMMGIWLKKRKPKNAPNPSPHEAAELKAACRTDDNGCYLRREMFWACMKGAGLYIRMEYKKQITTKDGKTMLGLLLSLEEKRIYLITPRKPGWEVDIRPTQKKDGNTVVVVRPRFDEWMFKVTIHIDTASSSLSAGKNKIN